MAKKFVRGITDIKNIEHQDFDTNNVNDLLSDGKHNYIHRKKNDGTEEYHNLTNNIKNIQSDDTDLLTVTNYNNTTNSATIRPKHDSQKEQLLESTDNTILITHGENGTDETTSVDVNPAKVLEHENLVSNSDYVTIEHEEGSATTEIKTDELDSKIIEIEEKIPKTVSQLNLAQDTSLTWTPYVDITQHNNWNYTLCNLNYGNETGIYNNTKINLSVFISADDVELDSAYTPKIYLHSYDVKKDGTGNDWDVETDCFLGKFTKTLTPGNNYYLVKASMTTLPNAESLYSSIVPQIRIDGASSGKFHVRALMVTTGDMMPDYWLPSVNDNQVLSRETYTHANGILKTHVKSLYQNSIISTLDEEFNFLAKMNKTQTSADFTLNAHDTAVFQYLIDTYGVDNKINVCGSAFTLNGSNLNFNSNGAQYNPHIITFTDIIPTGAINPL